MKSISDGKTAGDDPAVLSIGEVSRRTGIPVAGLRNWEQRYGLPRPQRLPNGRRRYRESDCLLLEEVLRGRAQGRSLAAAMAHALSGAGPFRDTSIFAGLRRRHPGLQVHVMAKAMLLALTHAIEDECCARAQRPVLVGAFQRQRFYRQARPRWTDLARTAAQTLVFADFGQRSPQSGPLAEIPIAEDSPLRREWALVCDAPDHPACLAGWEHPGQKTPLITCQANKGQKIPSAPSTITNTITQSTHSMPRPVYVLCTPSTACKFNSRPVKRRKASRYLACVRSTTSSGSPGAGACLFQWIVSR